MNHVARVSASQDVQVFDLPRPPSTNALFANVPGRGRVRCKRYREWANAAGWELKAQRARPVDGPVELTIILTRNTSMDLSNCVKAVEDLLVENRVIPDDSKAFVKGLHLQWGDVVGCRVFVEPAGRRAA